MSNDNAFRLKEGERITIREDALQDAPRLMRHCGKAGKVVVYWSRLPSRDIVMVRLDDGTSLCVYADEIVTLQQAVGG